MTHTSVPIAKSVQFELGENSQGRYTFLSAKVYGEPLLILAFYVPPPFSVSIILEGLSHMAKYPTTQVVWLGDFNTVLNATLDKLHTSQLTAGPARDTRFYELIYSSISLTTGNIGTPLPRLIPASLPPIDQCLELTSFSFLRVSHPDC